MTEQLSKAYDPKTVERAGQRTLAVEVLFSRRAVPRRPRSARPFTIVIPPPNVTAALHLGHALNNTLQDILIRFRRMEQYETLWMPGTDHAGIATQTVVEKRILAEEGKRRTDFQREEFVRRIQAWKDEYEATILGQLKAMGCSCDWQRTRFTMDEVCAKAVRATFFKLFKDGLIYRGKRLVNWDPATQTVLADDEVEHETIQGFFWYMKYPLVEPVEMPRDAGILPAQCRGRPARACRGRPALGATRQRRHRQTQGRYLPHWIERRRHIRRHFPPGGQRSPTKCPRPGVGNGRKSSMRASSKAVRSRSRANGARTALYSTRRRSRRSWIPATATVISQRPADRRSWSRMRLRHFDGERYEIDRLVHHAQSRARDRAQAPRRA